MSSKDKWVRRFAVDQTAKHKNGFTIYKITSVLFPIDSPEAVTAVSVWKRYSDIQSLHKSMRSLHIGLHLRGTFPVLPKYSFFKRFQKDVIEERAKTIKTLLEFLAEHRLLFTSTDFVNFLQTGYPEPENQSGGVINAIRSSLHLPIEETPPLEYNTEDDDSTSAAYSARSDQPSSQPITTDETDCISQIPIYEAADVEIRQSPKISKSDSFESINSLESIDSDLYEELNKLTIDKSKPSVKSKLVLPDLINFDGPSTSKFDDYHTMPRSGSDTVSLSSNICSSTSQDLESRRSSSRVSVYSKSVLSLSNVECKTKTEDSYVFEAGYMLNLATRCENMGDFSRAFECYKSGIEKMLIGVQSDTDPHRRALIKEKTNKYLSYAEEIYKNHLCDVEQSLLPERDSRALHCPIPISMLKRPYEDLSLYRVLAVLGSSMMLVLHKNDQTCYAMKVTQKVPNNLTEFDEYFLQRANETRQPILPTVIPYMVPLHAYIETNNLIFLILSYAPGEKLFDYIKNYEKSSPTTPAREVNLENVFSEPLKPRNMDQNENSNDFDTADALRDCKSEPNVITRDLSEANANTQLNLNVPQSDSAFGRGDGALDASDSVNDSASNNNDSKSDSEVQELVINSQKLLMNVDKVLNESKLNISRVSSKYKTRDVLSDKVSVSDESSVKIVTEYTKKAEKIHKPSYRLSQPRQALPPSAVCRWGAEILTALESLHNTGVICRDLNPSNILLGDRGQIILTYFISYPGVEMTLGKVKGVNMYVAPELHNAVMEDTCVLDRVCDYWSYGAVMYELLCGFPLSYHHRSVFTAHTILHLPDALPVEVTSLLTQLLTFEPSERLGAGKDGVEEIKRHPYFKHIDWQYIYDSWIVPD